MRSAERISALHDSALRLAFTLLALTILIPPTLAQSGDPELTLPTTVADDPAIALRRLVPEERLTAGLRYLASRQDPLSGAFGDLDCRVGVTALASLAFLAHGEHDTGRGAFGRGLRRSIGYLLDHQREDGYVAAEGDEGSRMHGHGYATLAFAQACGMYGINRRAFRSHDQLRGALRRAVALIVKCQDPSGGWSYTPDSTSGHEGSITVTMIQALRAARECGFVVPGDTLDRALRYLRRSQETNGSFRYALDVPRSSFELTAAATTCLLSLGHYRGSEVLRGRHYLVQNLEQFTREPAYPLYGAFYAAQVFWRDDDPASIQKHLPALVRFLLELQDPESGAFLVERAPSPLRMSLRRHTDPTYATALALLTLQIPRQHLPLFLR